MNSFVLFSFLLTGVLCQDLDESSELDDVVFVFPAGVRSEYDMEICRSPYSACNIIHNRYWLPTMVERQCLCPDRTPCPYSWGSESDNYTMWLSNRSQLKFCNPLIQLGVCNATQVAATITRQYTGPPHNRRIHQETQTTCFCPQWRHWVKIPPNTQQEVNATIPEKHDYACAQLNVCREREKCGNMRTDFFSTYYHCTCPMNHLCITEGRDRAIVSEMHYQGPAFQSVCTGHE